MKLKKYFLALASASLVLPACHPSRTHLTAVDGPTTSIIDGTPVKKNDRIYKMTARILVVQQDVWYPVCTASIIAEDLILTAAHCLSYTSANEVRIGFDAQPLSYTSQNDPNSKIDVPEKFKTVEVQEFVVHPLYEKSEYDHDMALIKLKGTIPKGFTVVPLLPQAELDLLSPKAQYQVVLAGFGLLSEDPQIDSEILRKTTVPAKFEGFHVVTDQTGGSGGCHGDSGGPAYLDIKGQLYLVGVTHGPKTENPDCRHLGVWGNPSYERAFFNESAQKMGSVARF